MKLSAKQLNNIAQSLDIGFICYVHKETGELKEVISEEAAEETGVWEEWKSDMQEIENEPDKYVQLEAMTSDDSYRVMEAFAHQVEDKVMQGRLLATLEGYKPFANFKHQIDNSDIREDWFAFKQEKLEEFVMGQIEDHDEEEE